MEVDNNKNNDNLVPSRVYS